MKSTSRLLSGLVLVCLVVATPAYGAGSTGRAGFLLKACGAVLVAAGIGGAWWWFQPAPPQPTLELNAQAVSTEGDSPEATLQRTNQFGDLLKEADVKLSVRDTGGATPFIRLFKDTPKQKFIAGVAKSTLKKDHPGIADEPWLKEPGLAIPVRALEFELSKDNSDYVIVKLTVPFAELRSKESFLKSDLMAGKSIEVIFKNSDSETDSGKWVRIRARMALQFVPQDRAFRILEGRVRISITEADENKVVETSTDVISDLRSSPVFTEPRR